MSHSETSSVETYKILLFLLLEVYGSADINGL